MKKLDNKKFKNEFVNLDIRLTALIFRVVIITFVIYNIFWFNYNGSINLDFVTDFVTDIILIPEVSVYLFIMALKIWISINLMISFIHYYNNLKIACLIDKNSYNIQECSIVEIISLNKLTNAVQYEVKLNNNKITSIISNDTINLGDRYYIFELKVSKKKTITKAYNCNEYSI